MEAPGEAFPHDGPGTSSSGLAAILPGLLMMGQPAKWQRRVPAKSASWQFELAIRVGFRIGRVVDLTQ